MGEAVGLGVGVGLGLGFGVGEGVDVGAGEDELDGVEVGDVDGDESGSSTLRDKASFAVEIGGTKLTSTE